MASFVYPEPNPENIRDRYADLGDDIVGLNAWREFAGRFQFGEDDFDAAWSWLDLIRDAGRSAKTNRPRPCPRVFVSHKQEDARLAFAVARHIYGKGFDIWLDIVNLPNLPGPAGLNQAVLRAAMIEMGLINCTHLIAVMTPKTVTSRWVPYEYGRVRDDPPSRVTVASFLHPPGLGNLADYVYLAPRLPGYAALDIWLSQQMGQYPEDCFVNPPWPFGEGPAV